MKSQNIDYVSADDIIRPVNQEKLQLLANLMYKPLTDFSKLETLPTHYLISVLHKINPKVKENDVFLAQNLIQELMKLRSDCDYRQMYGQKTFEDQAEKFLEALKKKIPSLSIVDVYDLMADAFAQKFVASEAVRSANNVTESQVLQFANDMLVKITGGQQQVGSLQELADG